MPWTAADADRHIKGLSPSAQAAWAKIANQALADCGGGSECEGKAVRIANAAAQRVGKIAKVDAAQGLVYGWASVVDDHGAPLEDLQGDVIEPAELEGAMVDFMQHHRAAGEMHKGADKGTVIESVVFTPEKMRAMGFPDALIGEIPTGAWIGVQLDPRSTTFAKVQSGELAMFSIQGHAAREAL
jgi:Putative phage serine protease XkdF